MIAERSGDIFDFEHQAYAHGVSAEGKMGAGIALRFRELWPEMFEEYQNQCRQGLLKPGDVYLYQPKNGPFVFNLVTQATLRGASFEHLEASLRTAWVLACRHQISDLAMPMIGCGLGGLPYEKLLHALDPFFNDYRRWVTLYRIPKSSNHARREIGHRGGG